MKIKDRDKDKIKDITDVDFIYQKKTFSISYNPEEKLKETLKKFINQINKKFELNDFDFFYEGIKIDDYSKFLKDIIKKTKNIYVERKSRIIKCPQCDCNESIIDLSNYQIAFYGCKYNHNNQIYLLNEYNDSQKVDFSKITCSKNGCQVTMSYDNFDNCLTCTNLTGNTQNLCSKHSSKIEHDETHFTVSYEDKNYYCIDHFKNFKNYCFSCNKNLCDSCLNDHQGNDHLVKSFEYLAKKLPDIEKDLQKIKQKINDLGYIIESIKKSLDGALGMYDNYYKIAKDINEKYKLYNKDLKNYRILRNLLNLNKSNKDILKYLEEKIFQEKDINNKINILINKYKEDREKYSKGRPNADISIKSGEDEYNEWEKENVINGTKTNSTPPDKPQTKENGKNKKNGSKHP